MIIKPSSVSRVLEFDGSGTLIGAKYYSEGNVIFHVHDGDWGMFILDDFLVNTARSGGRDLPMAVAVKAATAFIRKHYDIEVVDIEPATEGNALDVSA